MAAAVLHDLALVYARRGEIPRALEAFADTAGRLEQLASPGRTLVNLERDRAECLLLAGLTEEAAESSARAEALAAGYGSAVTEAEAALLLAAALLRTGATGEALEAAERARTAFQRAGRPGWTAYAQYVALRVRTADTSTPVSTGDRKQAHRVARRLTETGWTAEADQALVVLALLELRAGELRHTRRLLDHVPAARRRGAVADRVQAWYAEAELRAMSGDRAGARRAVRAGMRIVARRRRTRSERPSCRRRPRRTARTSPPSAPRSHWPPAVRPTSSPGPTTGGPGRWPAPRPGPTPTPPGLVRSVTSAP